MAKIINSNEELTGLIPNSLITVKGETPLFDKLAPFLDLAEAWVKETFTSEPTYIRLFLLSIPVADISLHASDY